jgi:glyoxylate reductase|tara:strand:+ start:257 stop:1228 length:972 start_codon:yes stop_codon:yes gene_type:complete
MTTAVVVATRRWTERACDELTRQFDVRLNQEDHPLSLDEVRLRCEGATVLCPWGGDRLDAKFIASLPDSVKLIACISAGTEHVDIAAAAARGIVVANTPDVVTEETADMTFALLLGLCRRLVQGDTLIRTGNWEGLSIDDPNSGSRVWGKTLGIIGLGGIGAAVAHRAAAFRMPVVYHSRSPKLEAEKECNARYCATLDELLEISDVVSLHCPLTEQTRNLIDANALSRMKPSAVLINTARGAVVDERALSDALIQGKIAGAGLDVFVSEPAVGEHLTGLDNVLLSPHVGTATTETRDEMGLRVIENIKTFLSTGQPRDRVER